MNKIFHKIDLKFYSNFTTHNQLMSMCSYSITTLYIPSNKDYHSCYNLDSVVYQTYPNCFIIDKYNCIRTTKLFSTIINLSGFFFWVVKLV